MAYPQHRNFENPDWADMHQQANSEEASSVQSDAANTSDDHLTEDASTSECGTDEQPWYMHQKFQRYWCHHRKVWQWYRQHLLAVCNQQMNCYPSGMLSYSTYMQWCQKNYEDWVKRLQEFQTSQVPLGGHQFRRQGACRHEDRRASSKRRHSGSRSDSRSDQGSVVSGLNALTSNERKKVKNRKRSRQRRKARERKRSRIEVNLIAGRSAFRSFEMEMSEGSEDDSKEVMEMEITEEMLEFFEQSAKHRKQRDAVKKEELENSPGKDFTATGEEATKSRVLPPAERCGVKRTSQMKQLYGKGAAMIHGMETAMQLNFDRNCDRKQPKYWPHIPLNIIFAE